MRSCSGHPAECVFGSMATSLTSRGQTLHHWRVPPLSLSAVLRQPFNVIAPGSVLKVRFSLCIGWLQLHVSVRDNKVRSASLQDFCEPLLAPHQWCSRRKMTCFLIVEVLKNRCSSHRWAFSCDVNVMNMSTMKAESTQIWDFPPPHLTKQLLFLSQKSAFLDH